MESTVVTPVRARLWRPRLGKAAAVAATLDPSADFAEVVRQALDGPVLRYSQRLKLIKEGERRGLSRFAANLVIASVLHSRGIGQEYEMKPASGWGGAVLAGVILQGVLVVGAWWVWH